MEFGCINIAFKANKPSEGLFQTVFKSSLPFIFKWYGQLIGVTQGFRVKIILFEKHDTHFSFLLSHFHWLKFALLALNDKRDRRLIKKLKGSAEIIYTHGLRKQSYVCIKLRGA